MTWKPSARPSSRSDLWKSGPLIPACTDAVRVDQPFLGRPSERRPVEVALVEVLVPRVAVGIELHERERAVTFRDCPQLGERDRVVAAEAQGGHACLDERREPLFDAGEAPGSVARRHRDIAVVDDAERLDQVDPEGRMERAQERGGGPDRLRPEARARAEARPGVEGDPDRRHVHALGQSRAGGA